jgi:sortase A
MSNYRPVPVFWEWMARILLIVGLACSGYFLLTYADRQFEQARENRELDRILRARPAAAANVSNAPASHTTIPRDGLLGKIEIPRIGVSATVREGDDARTLERAVGHIPGTALPGSAGNAGLAAHRDTFFRRLKDVRQDDVIKLTTPEGMQTYVVQQTQVVDPENVEVLGPSDGPVLTLITCYPFNYIGSAPQRFVVRAVRRTEDRAATAVPRKPDVVRVRETQEVARPVVTAKPRGAASRPARPAKSIARRGDGDRRNPLARFFKAAARGLGFAPRESRAAAQSESPDPRTPRR